MTWTTRLSLRRAFLLTTLGIAFGFSCGWRPLWTVIERESSLHTPIRLFLLGNNVVGPVEILELASIDNSSSAAMLNMVLVKQQISDHPWIKDVEATILPPNRLLLRIVEREPQAQVAIDSNAWWVDSEGVPFAPSNPKDQAVPMIIGVRNTEDGVAQELLKSAVRLGLLVKRCKNLPLLTSIHIEELTPRDNPSLRFQGGIFVKVGRGEVETKLKRLDALFNELDTEQLLGFEIDLRFGDRVILRGDDHSIELLLGS